MRCSPHHRTHCRVTDVQHRKLVLSCGALRISIDEENDASNYHQRVVKARPGINNGHALTVYLNAPQ